MVSQSQKNTIGFPRMIRALFVCHGSIPKSPGKASKINGFTLEKGVYYITTTPFLKAP